MKTCHYCSEKVQDQASKCRYCGELLDPDIWLRERSAGAQTRQKPPESYLSSDTKRIRRSLFGVSLVSFAVWYTGKWPHEIATLGLTFDAVRSLH